MLFHIMSAPMPLTLNRIETTFTIFDFVTGNIHIGFLNYETTCGFATTGRGGLVVKMSQNISPQCKPSTSGLQVGIACRWFFSRALQLPSNNKPDTSSTESWRQNMDDVNVCMYIYRCSSDSTFALKSLYNCVGYYPGLWE